jgi:hypothetical protein
MLQTEAYIMIVFYDCKTFIVKSTDISQKYQIGMEVKLAPGEGTIKHNKVS